MPKRNNTKVRHNLLCDLLFSYKFNANNLFFFLFLFLFLVIPSSFSFSCCLLTRICS